MDLPRELFAVSGKSVEEITAHPSPDYKGEFSFPEEIKPPIRQMIEDLESAWKLAVPVDLTDIGLMYHAASIGLGHDVDEAVVVRFSVSFVGGSSGVVYRSCPKSATATATCAWPAPF